MTDEIGKSPAENKTILVIEDDRNMNELICAELGDAGYRAVPAYDGKTGLELVREMMPDLILLDVMLPDTTGVSISREISNDKALKGIPVIIVTSKFDLQTKLSSYISGAKRYITKPFQIEDLLAQIRRVI